MSGQKSMPIHHIVAGEGTPPIVFVHGFACSHADWASQMAALSARHRTVAVDLRGHGASPGVAAECSIERYGADVAEIMRSLDLSPSVLIGHSMGCRVVTEAALQAPERTAGVILLDGSQFAPEMEAALRTRFAIPGGYEAMVREWFEGMFTAKSDPSQAASVVARAALLPRAIGETILLDLQRYDVVTFTEALARLRVPVMAVQATYSNARRERQSLAAGQTTPFLDMLHGYVASLRVAVIEETGHFPQLDEPARTNALIEGFVASL